MISIITVTLNAEKHLISNLRSVSGQTYENFEHIIIDGGSTDRTVQMVHDFYSNSSISYILVSEKDEGISDAFNKGLSLAKGEYFIFLNSDDLFYCNDSLNIISDYLRSDKNIYCFGIVFKQTGKIVYPRWNWLSGEYEILHPGAVIGRSVFKRIGNFDTSFRIAMDYEFWLRAQREKVNFVFIRIVLTRFDANGISNSNYPLIVDENKRARELNSIRESKALIFLRVLIVLINNLRPTICRIFCKK
jgi:glycosyltransferase involved in cell wall biosynthesis